MTVSLKGKPNNWIGYKRMHLGFLTSWLIWYIVKRLEEKELHPGSTHCFSGGYSGTNFLFPTTRSLYWTFLCKQRKTALEERCLAVHLSELAQGIPLRTRVVEYLASRGRFTEICDYEYSPFRIGLHIYSTFSTSPCFKPRIDSLRWMLQRRRLSRLRGRNRK